MSRSDIPAAFPADYTNRLGMLRKRASLAQAVREFFITREFLEVDTPLRLPALIPEANIHTVTSGDWFLQTSPEICMKRLLSAGLSRIFQLCKCFRATERGRRHIPEFTMLEWYATQANYLDLMNTCEALLLHIIERLDLPQCLDFEGVKVDFGGQWERLTVEAAFGLYAPISAAEALAQGIFDEILVVHVEPKLGRYRPTFLYDYPVELASLARPRGDNPEVAERVELYVGGLELANGFSELTDAAEQRQRFEAERKTIQSDGRNPGPMPEQFLADLTRMPPAAGMALGFDRLVMCLFGIDKIDEVVTFTPEEL